MKIVALAETPDVEPGETAAMVDQAEEVTVVVSPGRHVQAILDSFDDWLFRHTQKLAA